MRNHDDIARRLSVRLSELRVRRDAIEQDLRQPLDQDSAEQAIDLEDDQALTGVDEVLGAEIVATQRALQRVEAGTYGKCIRCGDDIAVARLEALPVTSYCIRCADQPEPGV